jgi:hypothetical protein
MSALWEYAMRGVEAEAKRAKPALQSHQASVDRLDLIPDRLVERGCRFTGEKMKQLKPRPKRVNAKRQSRGSTRNRPRRIATRAHPGALTISQPISAANADDWEPWGPWSPTNEVIGPGGGPAVRVVRGT